MSTYKVIQDIEAEDHILGPLSLRQFIYGLITAFLLYLSFICITKGVAFLLIILLPPALFCGFFAFPFGRDQPTEVWALAKIRFLFKPRKRLWNQTGVKELVTITVPKKLEVQLTDGLSQTEVKSRLRALADTIDSRGWAIKNAATGTYTQPALGGQGDSDRLISIGAIPQAVPDFDEGTDLLDDQTSPLAQQFTSMIDASTKNRRQQLIDQLNDIRTQQRPATQQPQQQWFTQPTAAAPQHVVAQQPTTNDELIAKELGTRLAAQAQANAKLQSIPTTPMPTPVAAAPKTPTPAPQAPVTTQPDPAILNLSKNNDLNVATLAREAGKSKGLDDDQEVVIALH